MIPFLLNGKQTFIQNAKELAKIVGDNEVSYVHQNAFDTLSEEPNLIFISDNIESRKSMPGVKSSSFAILSMHLKMFLNGYKIQGNTSAILIDMALDYEWYKLLPGDMPTATDKKCYQLRVRTSDDHNGLVESIWRKYTIDKFLNNR